MDLSEFLDDDERVVEPEPDDTLDALPAPTFRRSEDDVAIDGLLDGLDIVDAYVRWNVKGYTPRMRPGQVESIMVRCPHPEHEDKRPSAWLTRNKGCGNCNKCGGFDAFDLAAIKHGYPVPGYKGKEYFPKLREEMARDLGYVLRKDELGKERLEKVTVEDDEPDPDPPISRNLDSGSGHEETGDVSPGRDTNYVSDDPKTESRTLEITDTPELATLVALPIAAAKTEVVPSIDWASIVPHDTFLAKWMRATADQDLPDEFFFWIGLQMVGLACGNDAILLDKPPVRGNLFLCLYGPSGIGKTRSSMIAVQLLREALPYDATDVANTGAHIVPTPGSAEAMVDSFSKPIVDSEGATIGHAGVRGLIRFDELSNLVGRANRVGNVIKPVLMEMYDGYGAIELKSRMHGLAVADKHFATAITSTQPGAIRSLITQGDSDSGFLNRWVFVSGPAKPLIPYGGAPIDLEPLVTPLREVRGWARPGKALRLTGDALEQWERFFRSEIEPMKVGGSEPLLTRSDLTLKKLILLFCANEEMSAPTAELVERVCSLFPYLRATYHSVHEEVGAGEFEDTRAAVLAFVPDYEAKTGKAPSIADINRGVPRRLPRVLILKVVNVMTALGELHAETVKVGGREINRYTIGAAA